MLHGIFDKMKIISPYCYMKILPWNVKHTFFLAWWIFLFCKDQLSFLGRTSSAVLFFVKMSHCMTKPTRWPVRPSKIQISLGNRPVLIRVLAVRMTFAIHWAHSKDSDQIGQMPRLIWEFAGCTSHFVGFVMRWIKCKQGRLWSDTAFCQGPFSTKPVSNIA